jgi:hypothetical protein
VTGSAHRGLDAGGDDKGQGTGILDPDSGVLDPESRHRRGDLTADRVAVVGLDPRGQLEVDTTLCSELYLDLEIRAHSLPTTTGRTGGGGLASLLTPFHLTASR